MGMTEQFRLPTRRQVLAGVAAGSAVLAGCLGDDDDAPATGDGTGDRGADEATVPVRGDRDAAVTLEVYEDYACGFCQDYVMDGAPTLVAEYVDPGDIRYEHRDLPIPVADPESWEAASAAREVLELGGSEAFWEYKERLYEEQGRIGTDTPELYADLAAEVDVDGEDVQSAAVDRIYDGAVEADRQRGVDAGVEGTPTFVVDGDIVASGYDEDTLDDVRAALDDALGQDGVADDGDGDDGTVGY